MDNLPLSEDVVRHTDHVTKCLQELWTNIRSSEACKAFVPGAEKIRTAVVELTAIFPHVSKSFKKNTIVGTIIKFKVYKLIFIIDNSSIFI